MSQYTIAETDREKVESVLDWLTDEQRVIFDEAAPAWTDEQLHEWLDFAGVRTYAFREAYIRHLRTEV